MHFVILTPGFHPDVVGGAWRVAAAQASGLAARGHRVDVVTAHPGGDRPPTETRDGVHLHRYPQTTGHFYVKWRAANRAAEAIVRRQLAEAARPPLLVQHHGYLEPAAASTHAPILHLFHGPWAEEHRLVRAARPRGLLGRLQDRLVVHLLHRVERRALRRARRILVLSRHFARGLARWHPVPLPPIEIVPGGVDLRRFAPPPNREALRRERGLGPEDRLLLAVRRLDPRMGLEVLVDAFARVVAAFPRTRLWLTGRGPAEPVLRRRIEQHGLEASVRLLGLVPDDELPGLLGAADATLMPSLDLEGFGLATAESLACGTPVLGSRAGATPELLEPLDPALLFEAGSVNDLAARLEAFLRDRHRFPSSQQCAAYARERFTWDAQVDACERTAAETTPSSAA